MARNSNQIKSRPLIFNVFKPAGITSYDVIRHFKRNLPGGFGKIGHIGTLDPFASGVLMIGISGGTRLNDYIHKYLPKTYIGVGKLGVFTETGDLTVPPQKSDDSRYLKETIRNLPMEFLQQKLQEKFTGKYLQAPHKYSAAKFQGRPLHQWAREGIDITKEKVEREIFALEIMKYKFPYLSFRVTVSSGTYIRGLFQDMAQFLGTYGSLLALVRERVGHIDIKAGLFKKDWPIEGKTKNGDDWKIEKYGHQLDSILQLDRIDLNDEATSARYRNGVPFKLNEHEISPLNDHIKNKFWIYDHKQVLLGMGRLNGPSLVAPVFNIN